MNRILIFIFCFSCQFIYAQYDHESVFPELNDNSLRQALVDNYKPSTVLEYDDARDTFMRNIDGVDNVLECVYTGYQITLNPNLDPTTDAFSQGINTEHTFPRSMGAQEGTNGHGDMHHLFPTRERANADRGNLIFREVPDNQADKWYFEDNIVTNIPSQNIDLYSELYTNEGFEPREKHKGDVARAYFYFYTMYKAQADNSSPDFFESQRETMCSWHYLDPVDEKEWNRNIKIAAYQDDKKNPFILDCRLARLYCSGVSEACTAVKTKDFSTLNLSSYPNPAVSRIYLNEDSGTLTEYTIVNLVGKVIASGYTQEVKSGIAIDIDQLKKGIYFLQLNDTKGIVRATSKFIKI